MFKNYRVARVIIRRQISEGLIDGWLENTKQSHRHLDLVKQASLWFWYCRVSWLVVYVAVALIITYFFLNRWEFVELLAIAFALVIVVISGGVIREDYTVFLRNFSPEIHKLRRRFGLSSTVFRGLTWEGLRATVKLDLEGKGRRIYVTQACGGWQSGAEAACLKRDFAINFEMAALFGLIDREAGWAPFFPENAPKQD